MLLVPVLLAGERIASRLRMSSAYSRSAVPKRTLQQGTTLTFAAKGTRAVATKAVVFEKFDLPLERFARSRADRSFGHV